MEGRLNVVVFMAVFVAAMLSGSSAQTTHVAGDSLGWIVPPGGDIAYRTWAATRTFVVGDTLVFNFTTGMHDVAEVSKSSFDSCDANNPISMSTNGPTTVNLTSAGEFHFICTFGRHCDLGQKLAINVSAASAAPTPQSAAPTPPAPEATASPPAATPSPSPMAYTVGDSLGWTVPPGGPIAYRTWALGKSFIVGDVLVFNFTNGEHDVAEVTGAEFDSCNVTTTTTAPITTGPARITLTSAGPHYYICTFSQHCFFGQKLAINVTAGGGSSAPAPSSTATPPSAGSSPPPSSTATPPSAGSSPPPSSTATPPPSSTTPPPSSGGSTPSTPSPSTPTPPPPASNSAPSFAVTASPITFLVVALAFLFN